MKERMGIVEDDGSVELQYRRTKTRRLIFCAVRYRGVVMLEVAVASRLRSSASVLWWVLEI
jgi:hypothetical protein